MPEPRAAAPVIHRETRPRRPRITRRRAARCVAARPAAARAPDQEADPAGAGGGALASIRAARDRGEPTRDPSPPSPS